jgi:hypothetical protein
MTDKNVPMAIVTTKIGYEKLSKDKTKVLSVKDYVLLDNLWIDPAKAMAIVARLDKDVRQFRDEIARAVSDCDKAKKARDAKPKATKAKAVEITPALPPDAMAMFSQFMAMMQTMQSTTPPPPQSPPVVEPSPVDTPDDGKRETAKERADRLRERAE